MTELIMLLLGLAVGGGVIFLLLSRNNGTRSSLVPHQAIVEKVEKVFKIVLVEGFFSEIYDFKHTEKFLYMIPTTKKALLIVNAKVMMGYDFKKVKLEIMPQKNEIRILEFPEPEILSIDPEVRYYNVEDNLLNKFKTEDLTQIQQEAKKIIIERAMQSELPQIAVNQIRNLLVELGELRNWKLTGLDKLLISYQPRKAGLLSN
jgi:hypothetical protein